MATLVFTAVGTALGGPVGGAIGSLLGQSIDQQLFGGRSRGPRLGDLTVQTSTYGTPIPRIYGTMRVAGTVIWATNLQESSVETGAKGQPDTTVYSYSVSLAVALCSRKARSIKRIWADGKLLRGAAGDFKVKTSFRFHPGGEDQEPDPLIASIEGIGQTPAYRGLAVAVFEDLQLAEYGNRIPFLTFEVEADEGPQALGAILDDVSRGLIVVDGTTTIMGFAAHGSMIRSAVEPLVERLGIGLLDDGAQLRSPTASLPVVVSADEVGSGGGLNGAARAERTQLSPRSLPRALSLSYYDPARDYQTSQMRASSGSSVGSEESVELPAVLGSDTAKALAEAEIARRWAQRDRLVLRLPPRFISVEPGATVQLEGDPSLWEVQQCRFEEMAAILELAPAWAPVGAVAADPGRFLAPPDLVRLPTTIALLEFLEPSAAPSPMLSLYVAASGSGSGYRQVPLELFAAGEREVGASAAQEAVMGTCLGALGPGQCQVLDLVSTVEIELLSDDAWLESCTDEALVMGANLASIGDELIQFGSAVPSGPRRFLLSRLLRGRRGSDWAMGGHSAGERFVVIAAAALKKFELPITLLGSQIEVRPAGPADAGAAPVSRFLAGAALRPLSPVHLRATRNGDAVSILWVRRSRLGFNWLDDVEVPLGENRELYRIVVTGAASSIEVECDTTMLELAPADVAALGSGSLEVSVQQVGDFALSRAARITV